MIGVAIRIVVTIGRTVAVGIGSVAGMVATIRIFVFAVGIAVTVGWLLSITPWRIIIAGGGDMVNVCVKLAADMNIGRYVTFTGFLRGDDVARVFKMADLYVMPSVSEPFGIAPLEAISHDVPVIISKQSGVSEILTHVLKVDFWDTDEMANKILAVLRHAPLQKTLRQHGQIEVQKLSWLDSARELSKIYREVAS